MRISTVAKTLAISLAIVIFATCAAGQSITSTIAVSANDSSGAAVAGATVNVKNTDTNIERNATTGSDGRAQFAGLPVGPYSVTIDKAGFGKAVRTGIVLTLNEVAVVAAELKPAGISEVVTVTEDAPLLNTTTQEIGVRFDTKRITDLPSSGQGALGGGFRDVFSFGLSAPGVSQINQGNTGFAQGTNFSVNGARLRSNNFMLDGQDVNDPSVTGVQQKWNNPDAVQEFHMITNQFAAEYGRASGSVVNVVSKSGTNSVHGSAFWFHNDNWLNSRTNLEKASQVGSNSDAQPLRIENQFGGTLGGPIKKNRTFFFASGQRWTDRQLGSGSTITGAPTAAGRAALQANGGNLPQVQALLRFLPQAQTAATGNVFYCLNGGPPSATGTCTTGTPVTVPVGSITGANRIVFNNWQWSGKIDHQLSKNNYLNGRYLYNDQSRTGSGQATPTGLANIEPSRNQALTLGLTSTLTQTLLNEGRLSWSRAASSTDPQDPTSLLIPSIEISNLGLLGFNAVGTRTAIGYGVNLPQNRRNNIYQLQDNVSWTKNTHTLKFGIDFRYQDLASDFNPNIRGQLRYSTLHNFVADTADVTSQINQPLAGGQRVVYYSWYDYYFFIQDSWKIKPTFTLNYGLRYELPGDPVENLFTLNDSILAANGNNPLFRYNSRPSRDTNNFAPRLGFNWNPQTSSDGILGRLTGGNKTVIRGGYARTFDYAFLNMALNISSAFPFQAAFNTLGQPGSFANLQSQTLSLARAPFLNQTIVAPDYRSPYADQYSLEVQRELGANEVFKVGYIATKGTALFQSLEGNPTTRCTQVGVNQAGVPVAPALAARLSPATCPRVDPTRGVVRVRANRGSSIYHSMQVSLEHRASRGLSGGVHYTWSAFIDDASEVFNPSSGEVATQQDPFSKSGERARSTYDRPHRISGNLVYELPWYRSQSGLLGHAIGGWQLGSLMTFQSGSPFTVLNGADPGGVLAGSLVGNAIRPNLNTTLNLGTMSLADILAAGGASLFSPVSVQSIAAGGSPTGNAPRNLLRGDGLVQVDANISKTTKITERQTLQLRMDVFNLPNTRNFGIPNTAVNSAAAFLNEHTTDGGNRRMFLSLRYSF